jgi:hypothetical protein
MLWLGRRQGSKGLWNIVVLEEIKKVRALFQEGRTVDEVREVMGKAPFQHRLTAGTGYYDEKKMTTLLQYISYQMMPSDVRPILAYAAANESIRRYLSSVEREARHSHRGGGRKKGKR